MKLVLIFTEWVLVAIVFSSVVACGKALFQRKRKRTAARTLGMAAWCVLGLGLFFVLFGHANSGRWLWDASGRKSDPRTRMPSATSSAPKPGHVEQAYVNSEYGFSIQFPRGWEVTGPISSETAVIKAKYHAPDNSFATLIVYVHESDEPIDIRGTTPRDFLQGSYGSKAEFLAGGQTVVNGNRAMWIRFRLKGMDRAITYIIPHGNRVFCLFGQTLLGDDEWYDRNEPLIVSSMQSFRLAR